MSLALRVLLRPPTGSRRNKTFGSGLQPAEGCTRRFIHYGLDVVERQKNPAAPKGATQRSVKTPRRSFETISTLISVLASTVGAIAAVVATVLQGSAAVSNGLHIGVVVVVVGGLALTGGVLIFVVMVARDRRRGGVERPLPNEFGDLVTGILTMRRTAATTLISKKIEDRPGHE